MASAENSMFAAYATGTAFRIDLTKRMVNALFSAANGEELTIGHYGAHGLLNRGLVTPTEAPKSYYQTLEITEAGMMVAQLCEMAGMGRINPKETLT